MSRLPYVTRILAGERPLSVSTKRAERPARVFCHGSGAMFAYISDNRPVGAERILSQSVHNCEETCSLAAGQIHIVFKAKLQAYGAAGVSHEIGIFGHEGGWRVGSTT
jgi:hypothetical protein